jgi:hypothetical protein
MAPRENAGRPDEPKAGPGRVKGTHMSGPIMSTPRCARQPSPKTTPTGS